MNSALAATNNFLGAPGYSGILGAGNAFATIGGNAYQDGPAEQYFTDTAEGKYLEGSPFFQDILARDTQDIADQAAGMFASGGRYGSGAAIGGISDAVGEYRLNALENNYQRERDRQLAAAGALENASNASYEQQLAAAQGLMGAGQTAMGLAQQDIDNRWRAGLMEDTRAQTALSNAIQQWTQAQNIDWTRLGALQASAAGAAGPYGLTTQTSQQPMNPLGILGLMAAPFMGPQAPWFMA